MEILKASNATFKSIIEYPEISIPSGKAIFLQGPSGVGKSTLLRLFNATLSPDSGSILYNGNDLEELDTILLRQEVLLVGQAVYLFKGTIEDNFKEYYSYRNKDIISQKEMKSYLELCCADFSLDTNCETMSGGERQRVYIAICLSLMPKVLMLDEPTSALDQVTARTLFSNVKQFCLDKGITLLVVSHDASLTEQYADEVISLERRM
jgi:putative ABC transport system ATP-binding protein